jgi:chorismate synthase
LNSFGERLRFSTFGESHGKAIGCILDGVPAGLDIDEEYIQSELDRRKPGKSEFETARKEADKVEILSGVFEGKSTGTPIAMIIYNTNQKSRDYSNIKDVFRPGHADFTYFHKYGLRDYRGVARVVVKNTPVGLGQPLYYKLDGVLADAMMGLNAVKAVEIGDGVLSSSAKGSTNNDEIRKDGFESNHAGGILGGISNGEEIVLNVYFKPTPSIFKEQHTVTTQNEEVDFSLKGRHDPCVAIRGTVVCESMAALVIADMLLLNMGSKIDGLRRYYK